MANPHFSIEDYAGVTLTKFLDSAILEAAAIQLLGQDLYKLADGHTKPRIVLDFSNVKILSSQMLGVLVTLLAKAEKNKGAIALCAMKPELKKVFTITNLDKVFKFYDDDVKALSAFGVHISRIIPDARKEI